MILKRLKNEIHELKAKHRSQELKTEQLRVKLAISQTEYEELSELALSRRTNELGEMTSALAHEINQPLTAINTYSRTCLHLMNQEVNEKLKAKLIETLEKIAIQAELAGKIVHNMKNVMQEGSFFVEETNINQLINNTLSLLLHEFTDKKIRIRLNLNNDLPLIKVNKIHIMQILLNLARNCIEAFQSVATDNPEITIKTELHSECICVHIADNGPGIPVEFKDFILNTYFTTKAEGTGIGLGICKKLIEQHGGKLNLQQKSDKGAWFTFTLPLR